MTTGLLVSEIFGPTIQGEGPSAGRRAVFVRLGLCNLDCAWCDTPYTWDWSGKNGEPQDRAALFHMKHAQLVDQVVRRAGRRTGVRTVVTGGEPLVQQGRLAPFVVVMSRYGPVEIETNGTLPPSDVMFANVDQWNVSPKLPHSGVDEDRAWKPHVVRHIVQNARKVALKFVACTPADVDLVADMVDSIGVREALVWIMPEGRDAETIVRRTVELADRVVEHGFNLSTRLHVLAWGDRRGV